MPRRWTILLFYTGALFGLVSHPLPAWPFTFSSDHLEHVEQVTESTRQGNVEVVRKYLDAVYKEPLQDFEDYFGVDVRKSLDRGAKVADVWGALLLGWSCLLAHDSLDDEGQKFTKMKSAMMLSNVNREWILKVDFMFNNFFRKSLAMLQTIGSREKRKEVFDEMRRKTEAMIKGILGHPARS